MTQPQQITGVMEGMSSFLDDLATEDQKALERLNRIYITHFKAIQADYENVLAGGGAGTSAADRLDGLRSRIITRLNTAGLDAKQTIDFMAENGFNAGIQDAYQLASDALDLKIAATKLNPLSDLNFDFKNLIGSNKQAMLSSGFGEPNPDVYSAWAGSMDTVWNHLMKSTNAETASGIMHEMKNAVLSQQNPQQTATNIVKKFDILRRRALLIARTEQMRAYRGATSASYRASKVVKSWVWHATMDRRTCFICLSMHGTVFDKEDMMRSHPACRCVMVPITKTWAEMGINGVPETGLGGDPLVESPLGNQGGVFAKLRQSSKMTNQSNEWFHSLNKKDQEKIAGGKYRMAVLTQDGVFHTRNGSKFLDFKTNTVWGGQFIRKTLVTQGDQFWTPAMLKQKALSKANQELPKGPGTGWKYIPVPSQLDYYEKLGSKTEASAVKKATTTASAKKFEDFNAKKAALKKTAGEDVTLKAQAVITPPVVKIPLKAPVLVGSDPLLMSKEKTAALIAGEKAAASAKIGYGVKVANAKKAGLLPPPVPDYAMIKIQAAAAHLTGVPIAVVKTVLKPGPLPFEKPVVEKPSPAAIAAGEKAAMSAKIGYGVKVSNSKKAGLPPPPPPDYAAIKAKATSDHVAGITKPVAPKTTPAVKSVKTPASFAQTDLKTPLIGVEAAKFLKAKSKAVVDDLYSVVKHDAPLFAKVHPLDLKDTIEKGFKPQQAAIGNTGYTAWGAKTKSNPQSLMVKSGGMVVEIKPPPGGFRIASTNMATTAVRSVRRDLRDKIDAAVLKYPSVIGPGGYRVDSPVVKRLHAINSSQQGGSRYIGTMLKKKYDIDAIHMNKVGVDVVITNPRLLKGHIASTYDPSASILEKEAKASAIKAVKAAQSKEVIDALKASRAAGIKQGRGEFSPFVDKEAKKLLTFLKVKVDPLRPASSSFQANQEAKHSVMTHLADRLVNNPVFMEYADREYSSHGSRRGINAAEAAVSSLVQQWASSSFGSNPKSWMIQRAAIEEFGLSKTGFDTRMRLAGNSSGGKKGNSVFSTDLERAAAMAKYATEEANVEAYKSFLRVMHDHTQEQFAAAGITRISIYRGAKYQSSDAFTAESLKNRAIGDVVRSSDVSWQPMSSWAGKKKTAESFANMNLGSGGDIKAIHMTSVPVENVIGTTSTGYGALGEFEVVVMDTVGEVDTEIIR